MAIRDLQIRLTQVGRIRLGISPAANKSNNPGKLETFRFTSPARHLIDEIARQYGGTARPWTPQGGGAGQYEVITEVARVPVMVPRQSIDPWYEQWGRGVCQRRCDGVTDTVQREACACDPDARVCKPTTRITVGLSDVPGLGVWLLESHGWNAASELSGLTGILQMLPDGIRLPGILVLERRVQKKIGPDPKNPGRQMVLTRDFQVPVIHFDAVTMRAIDAGGSAIAQALGQSATRQALGASTEQDSRQILRTRLLQQIADCGGMAELNAIGHEAKNAGITDDEFANTWRARAATLNAPVSGGAPRTRRDPVGAPDGPADHAQQAAEQLPTVGRWTEARVDTPVDVELPTSDDGAPDPDEQFNLIMMLAGERGWDTPTVHRKILEHCGVGAVEATGYQLRGFRMALKSGQIQ